MIALGCNCSPRYRLWGNGSLMKSQRRRTRPVRKPVTRRQRKHYSINAPRLILSLLLILLAGEAVLAVFTSPWFEISRVRTYGRRTAAAQFVKKNTQVPEKSNILRFDTRGMAARLCRDPIIERVTVSRRLPDTLVVRITERKARLVLKTHRKHYEVDEMHVPFRIVAEPNPRLPLLVCRVPERIVLGRPIKTHAFLIAANCLRVATQEKKFLVGKITVDQNNDLCLNDRDGLLIRLGQPQDIEDKLEKAMQTIDLVPDLDYVDVTCPEAPAFKPKQSGTNPS